MLFAVIIHVMKQSIIIPCGWCQAEFKAGEIRNHFPRCPKRPVTAARPLIPWRDMVGRRIAEVKLLLLDPERGSVEWFEAFDRSWSQLDYIYETKIRPKPAEPSPDELKSKS